MDTNLNLLTVSLKQAIDLVAKRQDGHPNPYFKVALDIPDQTEPKHYQQTKISKSTSSPVIEEEFFFQVRPSVKFFGEHPFRSTLKTLDSVAWK